MKKKITIVSLVIILAVLVLWIYFLNSSNNDGVYDKNDDVNNANVSGESKLPDDKDNIDTENFPGDIDEESLIRFDSQGGIDIAISFDNILQDNDEFLTFRLMLNNHSVDLDSFKYAEIASLRTSNETIIDNGFIWELGGGGGHHVYGFLKLPKRFNDKDVITSDTEYIELEIKGLGNAESRTFRWEKDVLNLYIK